MLHSQMIIIEWRLKFAYTEDIAILLGLGASAILVIEICKKHSCLSILLSQVDEFMLPKKLQKCRETYEISTY
jgi:hypothetical protein